MMVNEHIPINDARAEIDKLDTLLVELLLNRQALTKYIGIYKKDNNINVLDANREQQVLDNIKRQLEVAHQQINDLYTNTVTTEDERGQKLFTINQESIINIFKTIMEESKIIQKNI